MTSEGETKVVLILLSNLIFAPIQIVFLFILKTTNAIKDGKDIAVMTLKQSTTR